MGGNDIYFQLLNPMVMIVFAVGFSAIYNFMPHLRAALWISLGYFLIGATSVGAFFSSYMNPDYASHVLHALALTGISAMCFGITLRAGRPFPIKFVILLYLSLFPAISWYKFIEPNLLVRLALLNLCVGLIFLMTAWNIRSEAKRSSNHVVVWLLMIFGAMMLVRMPAIMMYLGETENGASFVSSGMAIAIDFHSMFVFLVMAMTLFIILGMDIFEELHEKALTDPLSGILNRRGFMLKADALIAGHQRDGLPLSMIVCDIDHFKIVNDTYGHSVGDKVIVEFAYLIANGRRKSDICARIGGEEFCILLWNTDIRGAKLLATALREQVASKGFEGLEEEFSITASFGIAELSGGEDYHQLFRRADYALYQAKKLGRDRVCECEKMPALAQFA